jgi:hypothetical protein
VEHLKEKIVTIRSEMKKLRKIKKQLPQCGGQLSLTDPDARSMNSAGKGTGTVGYNVQTAVDTKNHMILAHAVTNIGHDRGQLSEMSEQARQAIGPKSLTTFADRGYFNGEEILKCDQAGITPWYPSHLPQAAEPRVASTSATSSTTPNATSTAARLASGRFGATPGGKTD